MKQLYVLKFIFASLSFLLLIGTKALAQQNVSISDVSSTPDASSVLDISSTSKGLLIPRVALTATNAASPITLPATSMMVYNTATAGVSPNNVIPGYYYNAGTPVAPNWLRVYAGSATGAEWKLLGNAGTTAGTNFLGTTDAVDLVFKTNNAEQARILSSGNVGIGTSSPGDKLEVFPTGGKSILLGGGATTGSELKLTNSGVVHFSIYNSGNNNLTFANTSSIYQTNTAGTALMSITGSGNVGIGTASPAYRLDLANGTFGFGSSNVRTETRNNAGLRGDAGAQSGFFETASPTNYPSGASSWWHLIDVRHSNNANNYAMQFAGSFFDQNLFFRKTSDNAAQPWTQVLTTSSNLAWMTTGNAGTVASTNFIGTTDAIDFVVRTNNIERMRVLSGGNVGIGATAPNVPLAVGGNGTMVYQTSAWIENNMHVQGNETLNQGGRGRMRVGTAWGYMGLYTDGSSTGASNDLVLGASSALVRVGPAAGGQNLRVSGLEGTGTRPVFADANGTLVTNVPFYNLNSSLHPSNDDITGWNTIRSSCSDDAVATFTWGFNFKINGINYTSGWISTNGVFGFGSSSTNTWTNTTLPASISNDPMCFFHWDDDGSSLQRWVVLGTSPHRICYIHSRQSEATGCSTGSSQVDVYITLHETSNVMSVRYVGIGSSADVQGASATYGFQFSGGSSAYAVPLGTDAKLLDDNNGNQSWSIDFGK